MSTTVESGTGKLAVLAHLGRPTSRRTFFRWSGATVAVLAVACNDDGTSGDPGDRVVDLGTDDTGVMNYAYALEQLEAAFYTRVVQGGVATGLSAAELAMLTKIRNHEIAHRDFFKAALAGNAIPDLEVDFSTVNFTNRLSILQTAMTFEDLGVTAYNGAGRLLKAEANLAVAGKIASVEARHAAAIRALLMPNTRFFAGDDVVAPVIGLEGARSPGEVLERADPFIVTRIGFGNLPSTSIQSR